MNIPSHIHKILRSSRRTIGIEIQPCGQVIVRAPQRAAMRDILYFIQEKTHWIEKILLQLKNKPVFQTEKQFVEGESFLFLGKHYSLKIVQDYHMQPLYFDEYFNIQADALPHAKQIFTNWYKEKAQILFQERIDYYAPLLSVIYTKMRLSNAKKRWGSCSIKGYINLNWRLMMAPLSVIDYVVVHELAHLKEMNHSSRFWQIVENVLPDYKQERRWLRKYGEMLI